MHGTKSTATYSAKYELKYQECVQGCFNAYDYTGIN